MTTPEDHPAPERTDPELLLRMSRRAVYAVLVMTICAGAIVLGSIIAPKSALNTWIEKTSYMIPLVVIFVAVALQAPLKGRRWNPESPEVKALLLDEFRQANLSRASRAAFIAILIAQIPFALFFASLPSTRAVLGMAVSTVILGMVAFIALFLFFDRE